RQTVPSAAGVRKVRTPLGPEPCLTRCRTIIIVAPRPAKGGDGRHGAVAQLGERRVRNAKVRGSIPLGSTNFGHRSSSGNSYLGRRALARLEGSALNGFRSPTRSRAPRIERLQCIAAGPTDDVP